jgi:hypothetical protein
VAEPSITTIKKLFALSSNRCAFPGCRNHLFDPSGTLIGRVCHICADNPGGKRYDPNQTAAERQGFANLILLCANHHIVVDDDDVRYTVPVLHETKRRHEQSATEPFVISDDTARRILVLMTGGAIGAGLTEVIREVGDFARALANALSPLADPKRPIDDPGEALVRELEEVLRYGPKGQITYYSGDPAHMRVGVFFAELFKRSGWRVLSPNPGEYREAMSAVHGEVGAALLLFFGVKDEHQMSNVRQTVDKVFSRCGFSPIDERDANKYRSADDAIRIFIRIGTFR